MVDQVAPVFNPAILFYIPNLIGRPILMLQTDDDIFHIQSVLLINSSPISGYARLLLVVIAHCLTASHPSAALVLFVAFAVLDGLDGYLARRLGQTSAFGAWVYNSQTN